MLRLALIFLAVTAAAQANIVINEVLAFNRDAHANGVDYPDVIELFNTGATSVDIGGYSITDDTTKPTKFVFPSSTIIAAGGYLIVYADSTLTDPGIHTGFGLNSDGDKVILMNGTATVDSIAFGPQAPDLSIGRVPNGTGAFQACTPTVGKTNTTALLGAITSIKINEWMAKPFTGSDWFEIFNNDTKPVSISGMWLSANAATPKISQLPALSFIEPKGFQKFWSDKNPTVGPTHVNFHLSSLGSTIVLTQSNGVTAIDRVTFGTQTVDVSQGRLPDGAATIVSMPGTSSPQNPNYALTSIVINEVLANAAPPLEDAIELYNTGTTAVNVGGWWLSDDLVVRKKYQIPANTIMQPGGYLVVYENQMKSGLIPFSLLARGDEVFLSAVDASGNLTGYGALVRFGATDENVSVGRVPATGLGTTNGNAEFWRQRAHSFGQDNAATTAAFRTGEGAANAGPRIGPVTINEIMYHPPDQGSPPADYTTTEYIELYNITNSAVDVSGWRLKGDSEFLMPSGASIPAHGFILLVSFDPAVDTASLTTFRNTYSLGSGSPVIYGPYSQKLSNATMSVEFAKPVTLDGVATFANVDKVEYRGMAPWPASPASNSPDGTGASLQRVNSFVIGNNASNWIGANPTPGATNSGVVSTLTIATAPQLVGGVVGVSYSATLDSADGFAPFTYLKTSGSLPSPLTLSSGGVLSGTPSSGGTSTFTVQVTDSLGFTSSKIFSVTIAATLPSATTPSTLPDGTANSPYTQALAATGGTAPYTWKIISGSAPDGMKLDSNGSLNGIPLTPGTFNFTAKITDAGKLTATANFAITIQPALITIATGATLPGAVKGVAYRQTLAATGGSGAYAWSIYSGSLPAGLTLSSDGTITGTPTTPGVTTLVLGVQESHNVLTAKSFTLTVFSTYQRPVMNAVTLGSTTVGGSFSATVSALNYPKTFTFTGLPAGLVGNPTTGVITGRATVSGAFNVQVKATNVAGVSASVSASLLVHGLSNNIIGTYTGVIVRDAAANAGLGARLTLTTTSLGAYTAKITTGITSLSASGFLAATAPHITTTIGGKVLTLTLDSTSNLASGTHGAASVEGWRSIWSASHLANNIKGYYTLGIDLNDNADQGVTAIPQGSGFVSFTVTAAGALTVAGKAADGSVISSAGFVGPTGEIAVYTPLYVNHGSILGKLTLTEAPLGAFADNSVDGLLTWSKPTTATRTYKTAFSANLKAYGKHVAAAPTGYVILGLPTAGTASLTFANGGLPAIHPDITFTYTSANAVIVPTFASGNNSDKTTLVINKNTGAISGTFTLVDTNPPLTRVVPFQGMIVRPDVGTTKAKGYFLLPQKPQTGETIATSPILSGSVQIAQ